jgi:hypothetical protein
MEALRRGLGKTAVNAVRGRNLSLRLRSHCPKSALYFPSSSLALVKTAVGSGLQSDDRPFS